MKRKVSRVRLCADTGAQEEDEAARVDSKTHNSQEDRDESNCGETVMVHGAKTDKSGEKSKKSGGKGAHKLKKSTAKCVNCAIAAIKTLDIYMI